jgi:hypothetical protein
VAPLFSVRLAESNGPAPHPPDAFRSEPECLPEIVPWHDGVEGQSARLSPGSGVLVKQSEPVVLASVGSYPLWMSAMSSDKHPNKVDPRFNRRTVLLAAAAIPGPLLGPAQALEELEAPAAATHQPTYRETEHIRTFYDRSRF